MYHLLFPQDKLILLWLKNQTNSENIQRLYTIITLGNLPQYTFWFEIDGIMLLFPSYLLEITQKQ